MCTRYGISQPGPPPPAPDHVHTGPTMPPRGPLLQILRECIVNTLLGFKHDSTSQICFCMFLNHNTLFMK